MAALAYLLPPLSGLVAYLKGPTPRVRRHGLQSVIFGALWPSALYVGSWITPGATQGVFLVGAGLWVMLIVTTAFGRDPGLRATQPLLEKLSARSIYD